MGPVISGDVGSLIVGLGLCRYEQFTYARRDQGFIMKGMKMNPYGIAIARVYVQEKSEVIKGANSDSDQRK